MRKETQGKKKGKLGKVILIIVLLVVMASVVSRCTAARRYAKMTEKTYTEIRWPDSEIASLIPVPKSSIGEIISDSADGFAVYIAETSKEDYEEYIDGCKEVGFVIDYNRSDNHYTANNVDGYSLSLSYDEEEEVMRVSMDEPEEPESEPESEIEQESEPEAEPETEPEGEPETEAASEEAGTADETIDVNGIRPEFKEVMDTYEAFFDEYCEFMKKYNSAEDSTSMLLDYTNYLTKYTEVMEKLDEISDEELSDAELLYYTEVMTRISQKLTEAAAQ